MSNGASNQSTNVQLPNLTIEQRGKTLVITVADLTKDFGPSSSGKSNKVATTNGILYLGEGRELMVNVNINRK